jgi:hypothetical protein
VRLFSVVFCTVRGVHEFDCMRFINEMTLRNMVIEAHAFDTILCFLLTIGASCVGQCFSTAGPQPGTGPWHQLYRAAKDSPGIDN